MLGERAGIEPTILPNRATNLGARLAHLRFKVLDPGVDIQDAGIIASYALSKNSLYYFPNDVHVLLKRLSGFQQLGFCCIRYGTVNELRKLSTCAHGESVPPRSIEARRVNGHVLAISRVDQVEAATSSLNL